MERAEEPRLAYLDTHLVLWLHEGRTDKLSPFVRRVVDGATLLVSPMVELEIEYLKERGRVRYSGARVLADLSAGAGITRGAVPFSRVVSAALALGWTRDPFDRLIVGEAAAADAVLLTRDELIRRRYKRALW